MHDVYKVPGPAAAIIRIQIILCLLNYPCSHLALLTMALPTPDSNGTSEPPPISSNPTTHPTLHHANGSAVPEAWDRAWQSRQLATWRSKVDSDLTGWRGGHG